MKIVKVQKPKNYLIAIDATSAFLKVPTDFGFVSRVPGGVGGQGIEGRIRRRSREKDRRRLVEVDSGIGKRCREKHLEAGGRCH